MGMKGKGIAFSLSLAVCVFAAVLVVGGTAYSSSNFLDDFVAAYPAANGTAIDTCTICHEGVPSPRNAYGADYANAAIGNHTFNAALEAEDSDGDGFTNLEEITALTFPGDNTSFPAQAVGFEVTDFFPADNAINVDVASIVSATFSEAVDNNTVLDNTFFLTDGVDNVAGTFNFNNDNTTVTFTPDNVLAENTLYTATLTTDIGNFAGDNTLADNVVWSFTTATAAVDNTAPQVISAVPSLDNTATGVAVNSSISAVFSEPVDPTTVDNTSFVLTDAQDNVVAGTVTVSVDNTIATFTPAANLANSATYTATVTTAVMDFAGNPLADNVVWTFTTTAVSTGGGGDGGCSVTGTGSGWGGGSAIALLTMLAVFAGWKRRIRKG